MATPRVEDKRVALIQELFQSALERTWWLVEFANKSVQTARLLVSGNTIG